MGKPQYKLSLRALMVNAILMAIGLALIHIFGHLFGFERRITNIVAAICDIPLDALSALS